MSPRKPDNPEPSPNDEEFNNLVGDNFTPEERKEIMRQLFRDYLDEDNEGQGNES